MTADQITLPDMPAVAGLIFRPLRSEEDAAALCAVHTERSERDQLDPLSPFEDLPGAEVFEVSVLPAWRRKGLARALLTRALQGLRDHGIAAIRLRTVAEFRTRASEMYRSVGFRVVKEYPRYRKAAGYNIL